MHLKQNIRLYDRNLSDHQYSTRNKRMILPAYTRTGRARDGKNYYSIKFFNKLPSHIQCLSLKLFKDIVKSYLVGKAFYSIDEFLSSDALM